MNEKILNSGLKAIEALENVDKDDVEFLQYLAEGVNRPVRVHYAIDYLSKEYDAGILEHAVNNEAIQAFNEEILKDLLNYKDINTIRCYKNSNGLDMLIMQYKDRMYLVRTTEPLVNQTMKENGLSLLPIWGFDVTNQSYRYMRNGEYLDN